MNYQKIYNSLLSKRRTFPLLKNKNFPGYVEMHHIIPKCIGGKDIPQNKINLTPREHYFCHLILCKIYPDKKLIYALSRMIPIHNKKLFRKYKFSSRLYQKFRSKVSDFSPNKGKILIRNILDNSRKFVDRNYVVKYPWSTKIPWKQESKEKLTGTHYFYDIRNKIVLKTKNLENNSNLIRCFILKNKRILLETDIINIYNFMKNNGIDKCIQIYDIDYSLATLRELFKKVISNYKNDPIKGLFSKYKNSNKPKVNSVLGKIAIRNINNNCIRFIDKKCKIPDGWVKGNHKSINKGKICIISDSENIVKYINKDEDIPIGWHLKVKKLQSM